jgi:hypothetical protein
LGEPDENFLMSRRSRHYWISLVLATAAVPLLHWLALPLRFDWKTLATGYWIVLAAQSIFVAVVLALIGLPTSGTVGPLLRRYLREPFRILLFSVFCAVLVWAFGWAQALILAVDAIAILEVRERHSLRELRKVAVAILLPASYLFAGFLLVLAYNCIIDSVRFNFAFDAVFNAADRFILHGWSVVDLSQWATQRFPVSFFRFLEFVYFGMFPQIGAGIVLVALYEGRDRGLELVGTILTAYYLALGFFYLWPSQGPYYLRSIQFPRFPTSLQAYKIQQFLIRDALVLWNHIPIHRISTDYFIAFPCMHIAQPLIVMWFLRRWKRIVLALGAYDALLIVAILLLEWHYLVDIFAGVLVAGVAIAINADFPLRKIPLNPPSAAREKTVSIP